MSAAKTPAKPKGGRRSTQRMKSDGGNLRHIPKGVSGNPGGRPKQTPGLLAYIRSRTNDGKYLVEFLLSVVRGKMPDELLGAGNVQPDIQMRDRISAAKELLERGYGKAPINIELDAAEGARAPVLQILLQAPAPSGDSAAPTP